MSELELNMLFKFLDGYDFGDEWEDIARPICRNAAAELAQLRADLAAQTAQYEGDTMSTLEIVIKDDGFYLSIAGQRYSALIALGEHGPIVTRAIEEAVLCRCSCCVESANMLSHGRKTDGACSCKDHTKEEQCDCNYCAAWLAEGSGK